MFVTFVVVLWFSLIVPALVVIWRTIPSLLPEQGKYMANVNEIKVSLKCVCDLCGSTVVQSDCPSAGCHMENGTKFVTRAR